MADFQTRVTKVFHGANHSRLATLAIIASILLAASWSSDTLAQAKPATATTAAASAATDQAASRVGFVNTQRILLTRRQPRSPKKN